MEPQEGTQTSIGKPAPRPVSPPSARLMVGLLLACLLPRALAALGIPSVNPDGTYYIELARSLERGDLAGGFQGMNIYPAILLGVHRTGFDWEMAAKVWGVLVSTLVVLPLYGWVRRQFDDRVALAACFLYIVHPKFIELSPEVIRDSTFWFVFTLALYWQWRAIVEVRLWLFTLAGVATTVACFTRFEGLYLFVPLGLWSAWRYRALACIAHRPRCLGTACSTPARRASEGNSFTVPRLRIGLVSVGARSWLGGGRLRLATGVAVCLTVLPAVVLAATLFWVQARGEWLLPRMDPGVRALAWLQSVYDRLTSDSASGAADAGSMSVGRMCCIFFPIMTRGLSPCFALLMFGGLWKWRRIWIRPEHQALFLTALVFLLSSWIQLWFDRQLCFRYALPIVLMASPFAALGLLGVTTWSASWGERTVWHCLPAAAKRSPRDEGLGAAGKQWHTHGVLRRIGAMGPSIFVAVAGMTGAWLGLQQTFAPRKAAAALGVWLREQCPACPTLVGPSGLTPVAGYYAQGRWEMYRRDVQQGDEVAGLVQRVRPDAVLLLATRYLGPDQCRALVDRMRSSGLEPVETPPSVRDCGELCVLIRRRPSAAQRTAAHDLLSFPRNPEPRTPNAEPLQR